ncbi:MAG: hypothetical protein RMI89_09275 [Gloeomargarita sp. SKYBB_i_bin120]|nr:hypothetical protein [Gloeomargarita sp. SKYG98]MCS7293144.1 hypothetical protein [Gloeomargarita sp. SKYB120]MDW8178709.1 hypothetical protein [Gloeomargarita sp. SKYBB_i_bin120]
MTYGGAPRDMSRLLTYGYRVRVEDYLASGWNIEQSILDISIGYSVVYTATSLIWLLLPFPLDFLLAVLVFPPLTAGAHIVAYKRLRGETVEFTDFFKGFKKFISFVLAQFVSSLVTNFGALIFLLPGIIALLPTIIRSAGQLEKGIPDIPATAVILLGLGLVPALAVAIYLSTCFMFIFPLIIDQDLDFWSAITNSWRLVNRNF